MSWELWRNYYVIFSLINFWQFAVRVLACLSLFSVWLLPPQRLDFLSAFFLSLSFSPASFVHTHCTEQQCFLSLSLYITVVCTLLTALLYSENDEWKMKEWEKERKRKRKVELSVAESCWAVDDDGGDGGGRLIWFSLSLSPSSQPSTFKLIT